MWWTHLAHVDLHEVAHCLSELRPKRVSVQQGATKVDQCEHCGLTYAHGATTKEIRCEQCGRSYAYELCRTGRGSPKLFFGFDAARAEALENLSRALAEGIDLVPCPACGWYQSSMIPKARRLHRRRMLYVGQCLTIGLIPVAIIGIRFNFNAQRGDTSIPWPLFVAGLIVLCLLGIGMIIGKYALASGYDPNDQDVETRKQLGQSRAILLPQQEEMGPEASREEEF